LTQAPLQRCMHHNRLMMHGDHSFGQQTPPKIA
jgi:hypothetical protein